MNNIRVLLTDCHLDKLDKTFSHMMRTKTIRKRQTNQSSRNPIAFVIQIFMQLVLLRVGNIINIKSRLESGAGSSIDYGD